jgi:DNA polymerase-3 subunit alpha
MFIGQAIAGWSLARADQLRKTLGKKIIDDIGKEKIDFVKGGMRQGHDEEWLTDLFETFIEPAAKYLFNKSHACAYGLLSYQTAYLKCNYPTFYFAALLKSIEDHPKREEKMAAYIADARELGVAILPPDINVSDFSFTAIPAERSVRFGMNGVKNVGSKAVLEIIKERKNGPFTEFFSTVERIKSTLVNSRCIESLVLSGGFDSIPGSRAAKASSLDVAFTRADAHKEDAKRVKAGGKPVKRKNPLPDAVLAEAADDELEMLSKERELIGYYLSNHPYLAVASSIHASHTIQSSREEESGTVVSVGGIVSRLTEHTTKKGKQKMFFGAIEDDKAVLEFVIFPRQYDDAKAIIKLDRPVVLHGKIENSGDDDGESSSSKLIVNKVESVGIGIKKLKGTKLEKHIVLGTNYRKQLSDLRAEMNKVKENDCCNVKIELPNGKVVKVIK